LGSQGRARRRPRRGANAILEAALDEFSARGFAAARLDDVGADKEALFEELVRFQLYRPI
jgi:hypothetical protein